MKHMKKIIALFCLIMMTVGVVSVAVLAVDNNSVITETGNTMTRAQWLHNLAVVFEMEVEDDNYPDNYYSDLSADHVYYIDMMLNIQFGVIDIEAGGELHPDDRLTREFAAQTLNSCLGYQLDEETYTFNDAEDCMYPADDQVAVNRGWFALVSGAFLPNAEVQDSEAAAMVADAQAVLGQFEIDENYDSQYTFKNGVIEIPDGTDVTVEDDKVLILNNPVVLSEGQTFVVYINGVPVAYRAVRLSVSGDETTVTVEDAENDAVLESADAQGSFELDENYEIIPADNGEVTIEEEEVSTSPSKAPGLRKISGKKFIKKTLTVTNTLSLCDEASINYTVKMTNPVINYSCSTWTGSAYATIDADTVISYSAKFDIAKAIPSESLRLFTVNILGIGSFDICLDLSLAGSISGNTSGHLTAGISHTRSDGFRVERSFKLQTFSLSAEVSGKVGLIAKLGITDLPVLKAYVWAKFGGQATFRATHYMDGKKPTECVSFYANLYCSVGATASVKILAYSKSCDYECIVWNEKNSPVKIVHHYEDKKEVLSCSREGSSGSNPYFTLGSSAWAGSGWSGSTSNSYGLSASGEPIVLYTYSLDDDENATITKYLGNAWSVVIPEEIDGYTVTTIGAGSFRSKAARYISIPDTVTEIDKNAFRDCSDLKHVELSKSLTVIYQDAFSDCTSLTGLVLPDTLHKIYYGTFRNCASLTSINIPKNLTECGMQYENIGYESVDGPFHSCNNLKTVNFEQGVTMIPQALFAHCYGLESIVLPNTITEIYRNAFRDCSNLNHIELSKSLTLIREYAFCDCTSLTNLVLPNTLHKVYYGTFRNCASLTSINIPKNLTECGMQYENIGYESVDGPFHSCNNLKTVNFEQGVTMIPQALFAHCYGLESIVLPNTITEIYRNAFRDCSNLNHIELSKSLTLIREYAFCDCTSLTNLVLPNTLHKVYYGTFRNCASLTSINIPKSLTECGMLYENIGYESADGPFHSCYGLKEVVFEQGITIVAQTLFAHCYGIETITIPDSVVEIRRSAFRNCNSLTNINLPNTLESIKENAFQGCTSLEQIAIPDSVNTYGNRVLKDCDALNDVVLPKEMEYIPLAFFENDISLETIELPQSIVELEESAFNGCTSLLEILIPTATQQLGKWAFKNCTSLESFTFENNESSLKTIGTEAFINCESLREAVLPESVTKMNEGAFQNCVALESVYIPQSTKTLGEAVFMGDEALHDVTFADYSIKTIPKYAFKDCAGLESIVLPKGLTTISAQAFMNDTSLTSVTIPVSVTSIDPSAFSYPRKTVIRGVGGSTAETFANENGFTFVDITNPAEGIALLDGVERIVMERGQTYRAVMEYYPEDTSDVITLTADNNKVSINGVDIKANTVGDCVITATATSGVTYEFTIQIIDAKSIAVTTSPYKTNYILGEDLDCNGMVVTVTFNDGSTKEVTDYTVSGFDSSVEGDCSVTVSWVSANNTTLRTTFVVHVIDPAPKLTGIAITTPPTHTVFERRASLDVSGMVVMGSYTDGSQQPIAGYTLNGYNALKLGKQTITVSYEGFTDTFEVEVVSTSVPATGVSLDKTALSIAVGNSVTLTATVTPVTATNPSVSWTSSDETVATVENGVVTAKKVGTATITATTIDGGYTATCTVTVTGAIDHTPGDINGDGVLNNKDLNRLMKYLAGEDVEIVEAALDLNGDGAVNNKDLNRLMKYLAGEDVEIF